MPLYSSVTSPAGAAGAVGIIPGEDKNYPSTDPGIEIEGPAFLENATARLSLVRKQLSALWTKYNAQYVGSTQPYDPDAPDRIESKLEYENEKRRLEYEEAALTAFINDYAYVASLSSNDHDVDDIPSDEGGVVREQGGDNSSLPDGVAAPVKSTNQTKQKAAPVNTGTRTVGTRPTRGASVRNSTY